ncbi:MAG: hypothetical protein K6E69_07685 [Treponema sp.]|uniref:hypothetical protein n=1 Tax=Treponema sp. TaxID=166 RepID=UPI00298DCBE6|nr:hypothetical protein [Treponema sp.]MCR5386987.1 hypothetical protein [Treponema sp.]
MKKIVFYLLFLFSIISCNTDDEKSGIIIWEKSDEITYDFIQESNIDTLLNMYPKSLFIGFNNIKSYSMSRKIFYLSKKKWYPEHEKKFGAPWMTSDIYYFTIVLKNQKILTGISRTADLWIESAQMVELPYENPFFLINTKEGLKLTMQDLQVCQNLYTQNMEFDYDLSVLEQYFKSKGKLRK